MAQNENGEETKKSEHGATSVFVSSTTLLSLSEADGGRCGQQVVGQKVLARPDVALYEPTLYLSKSYHVHVVYHVRLYLSLLSPRRASLHPPEG